MRLPVAAAAAAILFASVPDAPAIPRLDRPAPDDKTSTGIAPARESAAEPGAPASRGAATPCVGGSAGGWPCDDVDLLAYLPPSALGGGASAADIWGWTDTTTGKEYALVGMSNGTAFVDVTDPVNPVYLGLLPTQTTSSLWRDVKVHADHAYVVSEASGHGMQVFDLTQLASVVSPPVTFSNTAWYGGIGSSHNVAIDEESGFAYIVGAGSCGGGLHIVDVREPASPVFAGCFSQDGYTHDVQVVVYRGPDPDWAGRQIAFASNEDTFTIADVTNKSATAQIARLTYPGFGYTHQGWLTEDHRFFLLNDELDESNFGHDTRTRIWDVTDLDAPFLRASHYGPTPAIDHNLYVRGNYTFQANYRAGLRILDNTGVPFGTLAETGYFDVYPSDDGPAFNGAWSVYPWFPSGTIVVSGIEQGLFVLDATAALGGGTIAGAVTDGGGAGLSGAKVVAFGGGSGLSLPGGGYSIEWMPPGTYDVTATRAGYEPQTIGDVAVGSGGVTSGIDFALAAGSASISGRVLLCGETDHSGTVVSAAGGGSTVTDAAGDYTVGGLVAGSYPLSVSATGFGPQSTVVDLGVGEAAAGVDFELLPAGLSVYADAPGASIPDANPAGVTVTLDVPDAVIPTEVDVELVIDHTWIGDLIVEVQSPLGTTVRLHDRTGGSDDDIATTYDDLTSPDGPGDMADFAGQPAQGQWKLMVSDHAGADVGTIVSWALRLAVPQPCEPVTDAPAPAPGAPWSLAPPRPNPGRGTSTIAFSLARAADVRVAVYDAAGRLVARLADGPRPAGRHAVVWDGTDGTGRASAAGVYFVRLDSEEYRATQRLTLLR